MRPDRSIVPALLVLLAACGNLRDGADAGPAHRLTFAFYNTENLFDAVDDPANPGDDDFTPRGRNRWTEERLERKLDAIARVIRAMDRQRGPDVIGLCEVENRRVLDRLVTEFLPEGAYAVAHRESPDERGIDVALLYRPGGMRLAGLTMHRVDLGPDERPTRDIMEATFERGGRRFTVLVNHWPSKRGGEEASAPRREAAARVAASIVDSLTRLDPAADIVMMGDFNDVPSSRPIAITLDAVAYAPDHPFAGRLINTAAPVEKADTIGSYYYRGSWETIDQIMLSRGALDRMGIMLHDRAETVFAPDFLRDDRADKRMRPPLRTYRGTQYLGGTSDHFPVYLVTEEK